MAYSTATRARTANSTQVYVISGLMILLGMGALWLFFTGISSVILSRPDGEDFGTTLLRYLDESSGDSAALVPTSVLGRARCEQWVSAVNAYLYDAMVRRYVLQYLFPKGEGGWPEMPD